MDGLIAFLKYEDFVAELAASAPQGNLVRVEALIQEGGGYPARAVFQIVAAAYLEATRQWAVCRIRLGSDLALFAEHPHYRRLHENSATAKETLCADLARRGYIVRGGTPPSIEHIDTSASCDLWRFTRDADDLPLLVAIEPQVVAP